MSLIRLAASSESLNELDVALQPWRRPFVGQDLIYGHPADVRHLLGCRDRRLACVVCTVEEDIHDRGAVVHGEVHAADIIQLGCDRYASLFLDLAPDGTFQNAVGAVPNLDLAAGEGQNARRLLHTLAADDRQVASGPAHRALRVYDEPRVAASAHVVTAVGRGQFRGLTGGAIDPRGIPPDVAELLQGLDLCRSVGEEPVHGSRSKRASSTPVRPEVQCSEELVRGAPDHAEIITHIGDLTVRPPFAWLRNLGGDNDALFGVNECVG